MKNLIIIGSVLGIFYCTGCHKPAGSTSTNVTSSLVITDFVHKIALPQYQTFQDRATTLNVAITALNNNPTAANLNAARTAWRDVRSCWEQCEGFLIGPVEDDNYDPNMDTWPVDYLQLDSFINTSTSFTPATLQTLSQSLRGFHPLEFILWGKNGNASVDSISPRQKQYMVALAQDILTTVTALNNSWASTGTNFQAQVLNAGTTSARYNKKQEVLLAMVAGITDICDEVGNNKLLLPYLAYDSGKTESPFSHNSVTDFTNNILGAQNVYLCTYNQQSGASLSNIVAARNLSLDNKIRQQFAAAIAALGNVTMTFETAIHAQRPQLQNAMAAITTLQATLDGDLKSFIQTYVTD